MTDKTDDLLQILICLAGRAAFPPDEVRAIVAPSTRNQPQIRAYNLCDGTRSQAEIAKTLKLDQGNFSRTVKRWEQSGILFRVGEEEHLLHLYPL